METQKDLMEEAFRQLNPTMVETFEEQAEELEAMAKIRFQSSPLDQLGWMHTYQAMYCRTLAKNIRKRLEEQT
jgi:hypothetical protein